jgi:hypothetical protein
LGYCRLEKTINECEKQGASLNAQADKYRPDDNSNHHQGGLLGPLLFPSVERLIHVFNIFSNITKYLLFINKYLVKINLFQKSICQFSILSGPGK